jgi:hypothetical protein
MLSGRDGGAPKVGNSRATDAAGGSDPGSASESRVKPPAMAPAAAIAVASNATAKKISLVFKFELPFGIRLAVGNASQ